MAEAFHIDVLGPASGGKTALVRALRRKTEGPSGVSPAVLDTAPTMGVEIDTLAFKRGTGSQQEVRLREIGSAMRANWGDYLPLERGPATETVSTNRAVMYVLDGSLSGEAFLAEALVDLASLRAVRGLAIVVVATKADRDGLLLGDRDLRECLLLPEGSAIPLVRASASTAAGLDELSAAITALAARARAS